MDPGGCSRLRGEGWKLEGLNKGLVPLSAAEAGRRRGSAEVSGISQTRLCFLSCVKGSNCGENPGLLVKQTERGAGGGADGTGHGATAGPHSSWGSPGCATPSSRAGTAPPAAPRGVGAGAGVTAPSLRGARGGAGRLSPCPAGNGSKANALSHGEMVSLDEGSFPALELNNRRLSVKNSFCRKNGIYTR